MSLEFGEIKIEKRNFINLNKQPIDLDLVNVDQIVILSKLSIMMIDGFQYFIGYKKDDTVRPLCIILSQMKGDIKYFEKG